MSDALDTINTTTLATIPEGWDAKARFVDGCIQGGRRLACWIAMVVAKGRGDFADPGEWIAACRERWGWEKAHVHHLRNVGEMLNALPPQSVARHTLMTLPQRELEPISRLPATLVPEFCEREPRRQGKPLDKMGRDEMREAVNRWLAAAGEPTDEPGKGKTGKRQLRQPDFLDTLFDAYTDDDARARLTADVTIAPLKAAASGMTLLDVAIRKYEGAEMQDRTIADLEAVLEDLATYEQRVQILLSRTARAALGA